MKAWTSAFIIHVSRVLWFCLVFDAFIAFTILPSSGYVVNSSLLEIKHEPIFIYSSPLLILTKTANSLCGDFPSELSTKIQKHNNKNVGLYFPKVSTKIEDCFRTKIRQHVMWGNTFEIFRWHFEPFSPIKSQL